MSQRDPIVGSDLSTGAPAAGLSQDALHHLALCGSHWGSRLQPLLVHDRNAEGRDTAARLETFIADVQAAGLLGGGAVALVLAHLGLYAHLVHTGSTAAVWTAHAQRAMALLPADAPATLALRCFMAAATAHAVDGRVHEALAALRRALTLSRHCGHIGAEIQALNNVGVLLSGTQQLEEAIAVFAEAMRLAHESTTFVNTVPMQVNLASALLRLRLPSLPALLRDPLAGGTRKDFTLALRCAREAMRHGPRLGLLLHASVAASLAAVIHMMRGEPTRAREVIAQLDTIDSAHHDRVASGLARAYLALFEYEPARAQPHLDAVAAGGDGLCPPMDPLIDDCRLRLLCHQGRWREAYESLEQLTERDERSRRDSANAHSQQLALQADARARRLHDLLAEDLRQPLHEAADSPRLHDIAALAERALTDIELSLGLLRTGAGLAEPAQEFDVGLSVEMAIEKVAEQTLRAGVKVVLAQALPWVPALGRSDTIESAVAGLLAQAAMVTPAGGSIDVGLRATRGGWVVSVTDGGEAPDLATFEAINLTANPVGQSVSASPTARAPLGRRAISLEFARQAAAAHGGLLRITALPRRGLRAELVLPKVALAAEPRAPLVSARAP
jgi:tetratricopeptide (TPR) repeat protein